MNVVYRRGTDGEQRYTASSAAPERPLKFRLNARRLTLSGAGTWPCPMHAPQVLSETLTSAAYSDAVPPVQESNSIARLLAGATIQSVSSATVSSSRTAATVARSRYDPLVKEPTMA